MGPPGGGRNSITDRMTRHLNVISIDNFSQETITKIFQRLRQGQHPAQDNQRDQEDIRVQPRIQP